MGNTPKIELGGELNSLDSTTKTQLDALKKRIPDAHQTTFSNALSDKNATRSTVSNELSNIRKSLEAENNTNNQGLISELAALEGRLAGAQTTLEKAKDVGSAMFEGGVNLGKRGIEMGGKGIDMINEQSMPVKLGAYGALVAGGSWLLSKIASFFGEGGKKVAESIGKGGRWIGKGLMAAGAAMGVGKFFGYDLDIKKEEKSPSTK